MLGSMLMRSQGRAAWRRFNEALAGGRVPAREVADGVLVIFGGALLLTPGFITDIFGLLFLLPPTRALIRRVFLRQAMRADHGVASAGAAARRRARRRATTTSTAPPSRSTADRLGRPVTVAPGTRRPATPPRTA